MSLTNFRSKAIRSCLTLLMTWSGIRVDNRYSCVWRWSGCIKPKVQILRKPEWVSEVSKFRGTSLFKYVPLVKDVTFLSPNRRNVTYFLREHWTSNRGRVGWRMSNRFSGFLSAVDIMKKKYSLLKETTYSSRYSFVVYNSLYPQYCRFSFSVSVSNLYLVLQTKVDQFFQDCVVKE